MRAAALFISLVLATAGPGTADAGAPTLSPDARPGAPKVYDEAADAVAVLDAAKARAQQSGRKLLIDFGANWCPDCRTLGGILEFTPVADWVRTEYEVVLVDVGRFNRNLDLAKAYGKQIRAIPTVLVVAPNGALLNGAQVTALSDAATMSPQAVVDKLAEWAAPQPKP